MSTVLISSIFAIYSLIQIISVQSTVDETEVPSNFSSSLPDIFVAGYSKETTYIEEWIYVATESPSNYDRYVTREDDDITVVNRKLSNLVLGCKASYPIYWEMTDVRPTILEGMRIRMNVSLENNGTSLNPHEFLSTLILSNTPTLTGMYTCRSIANNGSYLQSSVYVFLTGQNWRSKKLVLHKNEETIGINGQNSVMLPCKVTRKDVEVSLFRKENSSWVPMPTNESHISFDPKRGYTLYKNEVTNLTGVYKCKVGGAAEKLVVNVTEEYHLQFKGFPPDIDERQDNASVELVQDVLETHHIQCCSKPGSDWKPTIYLIFCANQPECDMRKMVFSEIEVDPSTTEKGTGESCKYALDDVTGKSFLIRCYDGHSLNFSGVLQPVFRTPSHKSFRYDRTNLYHSVDDWVTLKITKPPNEEEFLSILLSLKKPIKVNPQNDLYEGKKYIFECCGLPYDHAVGRILQIVWEDGNTTQFNTKDKSRWDPTATDYCVKSSLSDHGNENHVVMELGMKYAECVVPLWNNIVPSVKRVELNVRVSKPPVLVSNVTVVNVTYDENQLGILKLVCDMSQGDPAPNMTWTKDGETTSSTDVYYSIINDPSQEQPKTTILFMRAVKEIEGNYTCTATNWEGSVSRNFTVTVNPRNYLDYWVSLGVFGGFFLVIAMWAVKVTISEKRTSMPRRKQS